MPFKQIEFSPGLNGCINAKKENHKMKVLHLNAGNETGGGMVHILTLLNGLNHDEVILGLFEKCQMYHEAKKMGIRVVYFGQKSKYDLSILRRISRFIQSEEIQIVHSHGPRANLFSCLLKVFCKNCKWVTTLHSDPRDDFLGAGLRGRVFTKLHLSCLRSLDHYFAISNRFKDLLIQFGVCQDKITTIYNGINFEIPDYTQVTRQELGLHHDDFVMIMVARLHAVKGHIVAFEAMKKLVKNNPSIKLILVGDGGLSSELKDKAKTMGLEHHILFLGHQDNIHGLFSIADLKLITSYSESFPLVMLEAARAKVPVISTDVGGVKDLISSKELGWVIPTKNPEALVNAIQEAVHLKEESKLQDIGKNLYDKASADYSIDQFSNQIYSTYQLLGQAN